MATYLYSCLENWRQSGGWWAATWEGYRGPDTTEHAHFYLYFSFPTFESGKMRVTFPGCWEDNMGTKQRRLLGKRLFDSNNTFGFHESVVLAFCYDGK